MALTRKLVIISIVFSMILLVRSVTYAAPFQITISGLPEPISEIQTFLITLEVSDDFSADLFSFGDAIPTGGTLGWDNTPYNITGNPGDRVWKIDGLDQDGLFLDDYHDMVNGVICTFDYVGSILGVDESQLLISNRVGDNQWVNLGLQYTLSANEMVISAIPIPGAVWLLGSGLIGLVGIRRRFSS